MDPNNLYRDNWQTIRHAFMVGKLSYDVYQALRKRKRHGLDLAGNHNFKQCQT